MTNKMQFKNFIFSTNPTTVKIKHNREIIKKAYTNGLSFCANVSVLPCEISGSGYFYGAGGKKSVAFLEALQKKQSSGRLYLPCGNTFNAYLKEFTVAFESDKNRYGYTFLFVENISEKRGKYDARYTVVANGENLFQIAQRSNTTVENLMALNDFKNPFAVKFGDRVVLK